MSLLQNFFLNHEAANFKIFESARNHSNSRIQHKVVYATRWKAFNVCILQTCLWLVCSQLVCHSLAKQNDAHYIKTLYPACSVIHYYLDENVLRFKNEMQRLVAQASCEAEIVIMIFVLKEESWIEGLLD